MKPSGAGRVLGELVELGLTPPRAAVAGGNGGAAQQAVETGAGQAQAVEICEPSGLKSKRTREQAFEIALGAAAAYRERVGHLEVPRGHVESVVAIDGRTEDVRLGVWITTTRSRRAKLPAERITALNAPGMRWT